MVNVLTLKDAIAKMGDTGKDITQLKVDIEGSELEAIHEWIQSGVLEDVHQIGIEFHTGKIFIKVIQLIIISFIIINLLLLLNSNIKLEKN